MSVSYKPILWDKQKIAYDLTLVGILAACMISFAGVTVLMNPASTAETVLIRTTAVAAFALLHVILCIGPLARLNKLFLPIHYNRRHLGVVMFLLALAHSVLVTIQFHAVGNENPLVSLFTSYWRDYNPANGIQNFPFELFGIVALVILFFMAVTSHDFWLKNLSAGFWKTMHLFVHVAYGSILAHVFLGAMQSEKSIVYPIILGVGFVLIIGLHLAAWNKERKFDAVVAPQMNDGFVDVCAATDVEESCAKVVNVGKARVAVWRKNDLLFATSNVCRHQGGPVGEGRIVDGCATCPWHGWNYRVEDGMSPPPFQEVLPTYPLQVRNGRVFVHGTPLPPKTLSNGAPIQGGASA